MKIKLLIAATLFGLLLGSCKAWDITMLEVKKEPLNPKLLTLDRKIEDFAATTVVTNETEMKVFTKEVEENLIDAYGEKYGYIALKTRVINFRTGMGLLFLSIYTATIPNLFGMPTMIASYKLEVEVRIMDRNNKLLGKYTSVGESRVKAGYYYYSNRGAMTKAYPDALNNAFDKIRPQIKADTERINNKLMEAGRQ